jgi:hypothetical protein
MKVLRNGVNQFTQTLGLLSSMSALFSGLCYTSMGQAYAEQPSQLATAATFQSKATQAARIQHRQNQVRQIRPDNYDLSRYPVNDSNERHWRNILWTAAVVEPQESYILQALSQLLGLAQQTNLSSSQMRTVEMAMQVGTQLYLRHPDSYGKLQQSFQQILENGHNPRWVALALSTLTDGTVQDQRQEITAWSNRVRQRFPNWAQIPILWTTLQDVQQQLVPQKMPPLKDLLEWNIAPNQLQLYVFCPRDRGQLCTTLLKNSQGRFVRDASALKTATPSQSGKLWSVPLLLRSIHGLRWNFTRGETPQGIYRIQGVVPQPDDQFFRAYGQFPLVKLFLPFEGGQALLPRSLQSYLSLLPASWRNHFPIQQSFWAGNLGRGLIRIHGTGESPSFFNKIATDTATQDWNPSIGCLSALELYDEAGRLIQADMPKILNALKSIDGSAFAGYLVVIEVPNMAQFSETLSQIETSLR